MLFRVTYVAKWHHEPEQPDRPHCPSAEKPTLDAVSLKEAINRFTE